MGGQQRHLPKGFAAIAIFSTLFPSLYVLRYCSFYMGGTYQIGWLLILASLYPFAYAYVLSTYIYSTWNSCMKYRYIITNTLVFARRVNLISMGVRTASTSLPPYTRAEEDWESNGHDDLAAFGSLKKAKYMVASSIVRIGNCLSDQEDRMYYVNGNGIICSDALLRRLDGLINESIPGGIMTYYNKLFNVKRPILSTIWESISLLGHLKRLNEAIEMEISVLRIPHDNATRPTHDSIASNSSIENSFLLEELPKLMDIISKIRSAHEWLATESWIYQQDLLIALQSLQHSASQDGAEQILLRVLRVLKRGNAEGEEVNSQRVSIDAISSHWQNLETRLIRATLMWLERNALTSSEAKELLAMLPKEDENGGTDKLNDPASVTSENSLRNRTALEEYSAIPDECYAPVINRNEEHDPNVLIVDVFSGVVTGSDVSDAVDRGKDGDLFSDPVKARALLHELALHVKAFRGAVRVLERENGKEPVPVELFQCIEAIKPSQHNSHVEQVSNITNDPVQMSKLNIDILSSFSKMNRAPESSYMLGSSSDDD
jgi:hypothetical protein